MCVCRSVCLSIVLCDCIKTVQARITKSSLSAATNLTRVSRSQKRCKMGRGLLLISYRKSHKSFRSTLKSATLNNLQTQNKGFISEFCVLGCGEHLRSELRQYMAGNRQRQHASKIVSIKRRILVPRCLKRPQSFLPWVSHTLKFKGNQVLNQLPCDLIKIIISFII